MKTLPCILSLLFIASSARAQPGDDARHAGVRDELRALAYARHDAWQQRDRAALERLYADEFVWVHAFGYADDRATQIDEMLAVEAVPAVSTPSFDPPNQLHVYGDVAVHRYLGKTARGTPSWGTAIYARKDGQWQIVQIQGTEMVPERAAVHLDPNVLDAYVGRYDRGEGGVTVIAREGETLVAQHPGFPKRILKAASATQFFDKLGSEWTFYRGPTGQVTHYVLRFRNGQEVRSTRVE